MSICFELIFGAIVSLDHAREAEQLLPHVADPFLRCAFLSPYATALALTSDYEDAVRVARDLLQDAQAFKLDLMLPSGFTALGLALAGLRDFEGAHVALDEALTLAKRSTDSYAQQNAYASRMRVLAQERRFADACAVEPPTLHSALPSMQGEVTAARGLVLACLGRYAEATSCAEIARSVTKGLEACTLADAIECIAAVEGGHPDAQSRVEMLVDRAFDSGAVDTWLLVTEPVRHALAAPPSPSDKRAGLVRGEARRRVSFAGSQGQPLSAIWIR